MDVSFLFFVATTKTQSLIFDRFFNRYCRDKFRFGGRMGYIAIIII